MKKCLLSLFFVFGLVGVTLAQANDSYEVDWLHPRTYKAKQFVFTSDSVVYTMKDCKILEIKCEKGVTGYYVTGKGEVSVPAKDINTASESVMFRFNPDDEKTFIKITDKKKLNDDEFVGQSLEKLKITFRHCYHRGMNAFLPERGYYAVNFFSVKYGEILISKDRYGLICINIMLGTKI